jgi:hypothetical protein
MMRSAVRIRAERAACPITAASRESEHESRRARRRASTFRVRSAFDTADCLQRSDPLAYGFTVFGTPEPLNERLHAGDVDVRDVEGVSA